MTNPRYAIKALLILAAMAVVSSRALFAFFQDSEGPNLLVVTAMAGILWLLSSAVYLLGLLPWLAGAKRILAAVALQPAVAIGFYVFLR